MAAETLATDSAISPVRPEGLTARRDYLRVAASGRKWVTKGVLVQYAPKLKSNRSSDSHATCQVGITVSRKVGGAVVRNLMKRRLREIIRLHFPDWAEAGVSYVLVARVGADGLPFDTLRKDLKWALKKLKAGADLEKKPRREKKASA